VGYDSKYSLKAGRIKPLEMWEEIILYEDEVLKLRKPAILDFGAGGKGFLADLIGELLESEGFKEFTVDASGDILHKSKENKLRVGLEHPENFEQVIGVAEIKNQSICASAGNRRKWGKYHHIFNPETLKSVEEVLAVWVVARTGLLADTLATALFLMTPDEMKPFYDFEYLIVYPDYSFNKSEDFPGEIFYN
jgi:thiamine biosynthesis lipoprotein